MKTLLLISTKVFHYRVSVYNYLHRRFAEDGWNFVVASDALQSQNLQPLKFEYREHPFRFSTYRRLVRECKPDVVMFHLLIKDPIFWQLIHWIKLAGIPVICWTKGANLDVPESRLRYHLFNYFHGLADALVLYSDRQRSVVKPRHRHKIFAANNTVNFEDYPPVSETREQIKAEFGITFPKIVLFAGTMGVGGERKKVDHLIDIFRELDRPEIGLILVGGGLNSVRQARLNPKNTRYLGHVHDERNLQISKLFKAADLFVVPGHVGLGANQAFYWGLPLVTEAGLHPPEIQYLKPGRNGFMVRENDLGELREKMLLLLDNDELRREFSRNARTDIMREASIEGMYQSFRSAVAYAEAAKGRSGLATNRGRSTAV